MFTLLFFNTVKLYGGPKNHNPPPICFRKRCLPKMIYNSFSFDFSKP